jgi:anti-sigma B factor antagonist
VLPVCNTAQPDRSRSAIVSAISACSALCVECDRNVASSGFVQEAFMTVSERAVGAIRLLDLDGQLTLGASAEGLRDKVRSLLQQGHQQFIVNLARVPYMDSSGLGELVQTYATVTKQGGALKLVHLTTRLRDLLVITKLATVFDCYDTEAAALASFAVPA